MEEMNEKLSVGWMTESISDVVASDIRNCLASEDELEVEELDGAVRFMIGGKTFLVTVTEETK